MVIKIYRVKAEKRKTNKQKTFKNKRRKEAKQTNRQTDKSNLDDVIGLLILLTFSHGLYAHKTHETKYTEFNAKSYDQRQICFKHQDVSTGHDEIKVDLDETIYIKKKKDLILLTKCLI